MLCSAREKEEKAEFLLWNTSGSFVKAAALETNNETRKEQNKKEKGKKQTSYNKCYQLFVMHIFSSSSNVPETATLREHGNTYLGMGGLVKKVI